MNSDWGLDGGLRAGWGQELYSTHSDDRDHELSVSIDSHDILPEYFWYYDWSVS